MNSPETKANIALLALLNDVSYPCGEPYTRPAKMDNRSLQQMLVEGLDPATAFMPIAKLEIMPFRDAGNGVFDHALSIQVIYLLHEFCRQQEGRQLTR